MSQGTLLARLPCSTAFYRSRVLITVFKTALSCAHSSSALCATLIITVRYKLMSCTVFFLLQAL
jgi:hypothetical protein